VETFFKIFNLFEYDHNAWLKLGNEEL